MRKVRAFDERPSPVDMEDEQSAFTIDPDEDAALVKIEYGSIKDANLKAEDEHLRIQAEQEGRQLNAEENEAVHRFSNKVGQQRRWNLFSW